MPACNLKLDLYEDILLDSCRRVGASHSRAARFASLNRNEIAAVDIVACCKRITTLIENKASQLQRSHSTVARRHQLNFKDMAQLTSGVTNIYCRQVDILLQDTKHLLDQMKGTNFVDLFSTARNSVVRKNLKRKRVITTETKLTFTKRSRLDVSELIDEPVQQYYASMLSECQDWQSECTQQVPLQQSIELPRNYNQSTSYHAITLTEEFELNEDPSDVVYPSGGFGDGDEMDLGFLQELHSCIRVPRESPKRRLTICVSTDILPAKMPRLDGNDLNISQADSAIMTTDYPAADSIDPADITYIVCEPSLPLFFSYPPSPRSSSADSSIMTTNNIETAEPTIARKTPKNSGKKKLIIDKCIKYSRDTLLKHTRQYLKNQKATVVVVPPPSERRKNPGDLLSKLAKPITIFPDIIKNNSYNFTREEMKMQSEFTLRSILGVEFTENLVKEIFVQVKKKEKKVVDQPIAPEALEDVLLTPPMPLLDEHTNNNNLQSTLSYQDDHFDAHSVMMDLLMIWRNNPEIKGIDANEYIKSFPDRIKASLAFNFLLYLVRDNFIQISKKPNSIEMDEIVLGPESYKLIQGLTQEDTT